jgi:hypothetical protein
MGAHDVFGEGKEIFRGEVDGTGDGRGGRQKAHDSEAGGGFAGAGLAYEAESFAGRDGERDTANGHVCAKGDTKIGDFEQGRWGGTGCG